MSVFRSVPVGAVCLMYAALLGATPVTPSVPAAPVPLREALQAVWSASPEVQAARAELTAARALARAAAQPLYNPQLSLEAENADVDRRVAGLSLALDLSGKRRARRAKGAFDVQASEAAYSVLRRDVAARWLKSWSSAVLAQRQGELGRQRLALMHRFDELAAQRLKVGDVSSPERDLAGLALAEAQMQQASLIANAAAARAGLMAISGELPASLPALPDGRPPLAESMLALDAEALPELQQARALQAGAEAAVTVARRARIPDPTLSLAGGQVRNGPLNDRVIGLSVSIPLPVLNNGRAEIDAARADADAAAAQVRSRQFAQRAGLQEATARYAALREAVMAFSGSRADAFNERTTLLEKLWRAGEISTSDYLTQLKQSLDTALASDELRSRTWQAWFDYLTAAGRLTDWLDGRAQEISR